MLSSRATNAATGQSRTAPANGLRVLVSWLRRALTALRWFRNRVRGLLRQLRSREERKTNAGTNGTTTCTGASATAPCNPARSLRCWKARLSLPTAERQIVSEKNQRLAAVSF